MHRRLACLAVALLVSGCSFPGFSPPPKYQYVVITAGGVGLRTGDTNVPPNLDLKLHATGAPLQSSDVTATLDGAKLALAKAGADLIATVKPLLPLSSTHRLAIAVAGMKAQYITFSVIPPTAAMAAAHIDPVSGLVVDAVFADAPDQTAIAAALPGATVTWVDGEHARITWHGKTPPSISLPATITTAGDAHLDPGITLSLAGIPRNAIRRVTVPAAPSVKGITVDAFVINTALSNSSFAFHLGAVAEMSPTGWQAQTDGTVLGTPDQAAVNRAAAAGIPIWPSLTNNPDPKATDQLLTNPKAVNVVINEMLAAIKFDGYKGINVDFEGMLAADKDPFTAFVQQLSTALHAHNAKLIVDIVPHDFAGTNAYSAAYDVAAIGKAADLVDLMAYDEHGDGGTPGPVAGLDWDTSILEATLPDLDPSHVLLGVPLYGREWGSIGGASAYSNVLYNALHVPGARVDYDFQTQTPFIVSPNGSLTSYFDDADSLARKIALVRTYGLAGIAAWRLGFEDPQFWSLFSG
jgi:spore germination protein YaaH